MCVSRVFMSDFERLHAHRLNITTAVEIGMSGRERESGRMAVCVVCELYSMYADTYNRGYKSPKMPQPSSDTTQFA